MGGGAIVFQVALGPMMFVKQNHCVGSLPCPPHLGQALAGVKAPVAQPHLLGLPTGYRCACFCVLSHTIPQTLDLP